MEVSGWKKLIQVNGAAAGQGQQRQHHRATESHPPIDVQHQEEENDQRKSFLEKVREVFRECDARLFDVVDYGRQYAAGGMVLKKSDRLAKNFGKHAIAQIGCRGVTDILNLRGS